MMCTVLTPFSRIRADEIFRQHPAGQRAIGEQFVDLARARSAGAALSGTQRVGQHHQLSAFSTSASLPAATSALML